MSPKKKILRAVAGATEVRPSSIPGYAERPERYQEAVNELLQTRLLEGRKDAEGRLTIALNEYRRRDVDRLLKPLWTRPAVWVTIAALLAVGAGLVVV